MLAKTKPALVELANLFGTEKPEKKYLALVRGEPLETHFTVEVKLVPAAFLAEGDLRRHAAGGGAEELADILGRGAGDVPMVERLAERGGVHRRQVAIDQAGMVELAEDGHDATGAMDVLHVHVGLGRRHLA